MPKQELIHDPEPIDAQPIQDEDETHLSEYWQVCRRQIWLIISMAMGVASLAALWSFMQPPIYEATASVVIEREDSALLDQNPNRLADTSPEYYQTHFELLKSHRVLKETADQINLASRPEYQPKVSPVKQILLGIVPEGIDAFWSGVFADQDEDEISPAEQERRMVKKFGGHVRVNPVRGTRLAHVTVESQNPRFAAKAANTLASVYIDQTLDIKAAAKEKAAEWFSNHLVELRKKVEESEQALYAFRTKHGLVDVTERQTGAAQKLGELNTELVRAEMQRAEAQSRYELVATVLKETSSDQPVDSAMLGTLPEVLQSSLINTLRVQEVKISGKVAEFSEKYGPLHPKMVQAKTELEEIRRQLRSEIQKIYNAVKHEYQVARSRERLIRQAVEEETQKKVALEEHGVQYEILRREANSNRQLYDTFLSQMKETDLSTEMSASNIYVADPAIAIPEPVKPKKARNTLLGLLVGLMGGVGLAFFREYWDRSLKGPGDVERYFPTFALLGMVPRLNKPEATTPELILHTEPHSPAADSFRSIRTSVLLSLPDPRQSSLLVTSSGESEGKTTLIVNLAIAMAQLEEARVLLIDADLRKPSLAKLFGITSANGKGGRTETGKGVAHFLVGQATLDEIIYPTDIAGLSVIPHGAIPPNPSELFHSRRMEELLNQCRERGFQILIDTPPVLPVTDPVILGTKVDGVVFVVSAGDTNREACKLALQRLVGSGAKMLGVVVQKAQVEELPDYYYRYYKRSYSYGDPNDRPSLSHR